MEWISLRKKGCQLDERERVRETSERTMSTVDGLQAGSFPLRVTVAGATFESGSLSIPIVLQLLIQAQLLRTRFVRGIRTMFGEHCKFVNTNVEEIKK